MDLRAANIDPQDPTVLEFCVLEYRSKDWDVASLGVAPVVALVLKRPDGSLRFLIHPELRTIVRGEDLAFLESLLQDFTERAKLHPAALFQHLSSLGVGPLTTQITGSNLSESPSIQELFSSFTNLV
jgi:hypothetical protein